MVEIFSASDVPFLGCLKSLPPRGVLSLEEMDPCQLKRDKYAVQAGIACFKFYVEQDDGTYIKIQDKKTL